MLASLRAALAKGTNGSAAHHQISQQSLSHGRAPTRESLLERSSVDGKLELIGLLDRNPAGLAPLRTLSAMSVVPRDTFVTSALYN